MPKPVAGSNAFATLTLRAAAAALATTSLLALATGCATGNPASPVTAATGLAGSVHGGQSPITGSNVALYVTTPSSTGTGPFYGAALTAAAKTTTDLNGNFSFPAGTYTCPNGSYAYIVSTGGNPGSSVATTDNSAIFLVAALGSCANVSSTTQVIINEVTTVAAAYALDGFAPANGTGMTEASVKANTANGLTTSLQNAQGLADGFANAANIVNIGGGTPNTTTTGGNGTVPMLLINTLGDILQDCVNSTGPSGTSVYGGKTCATLFSATTSPAGVVPVNVWQAALNIAQYPALNVAAVYGLGSAQAAFQPALTAQPNDLSIGIVYTSGTLASPLGLGIDKNDNVYVSGSTNADLLEFSGQGALLSPSTGWISLVSKTDNVRQIAFDPTGNLWLSDGNTGGSVGVYQYTPAGSAKAPSQGVLTPEPYTAATTDYNNYSITTDANGNVFGSSYKKVTCTGATASSTGGCLLYELVNNPSTPYAATSTFSGTTIPSPGLGGARSVFYDTQRNNIWFTDIAEGSVSFLTVAPSNGNPVTIAKAVQNVQVSSGAAAAPSSGYGAVSVAIDNSGNGYVVVVGSGSTSVPAGLSVVNPATAAVTNLCSQTQNTAACNALISPAYDAIDGNGNVFLANTGTTGANASIVEFSPAINGTTVNSVTQSGFVSGTMGISPGATVNAGAFAGSSLYQPADVAVDRSGALWTLSTGSGTTNAANLVQILGVAAPTNPQSYAGVYGVKP